MKEIVLVAILGLFCASQSETILEESGRICSECANVTAECTFEANRSPRFVCKCEAGFTGDGKICTDKNECQDLKIKECGTNATCHNTVGSYQCACNTGFTGDGYDCTDIDECDYYNCSADYKCQNTPGSYNCVCEKNGYMPNGIQGCIDIDECELNTDNCDSAADCTNTPGSFNCACKDGYEGNGTICKDINECKNDSNQCSQSKMGCVNTEGSYKCGKSCFDDNQVCSLDGICKIDLNTYSPYCDCNTGFKGDGFTCIDVDECDESETIQACDSNANCMNTIGSYNCTCNSGYIETKTGCNDIDECKNETICGLGSNSHCSNTPGSYDCKCNDGYSKLNENALCTDINECELQKHDCYNQGSCTDTIGSYTCACESGLTGDGRQCEDIPECILYGPCGTYSVCVEDVGTYTCVCLDGFEYRGSSTHNCTDIDECAGENDCHDDAACTNTLGSYTCSCNSGFTGNGYNCTDNDECYESSTNNCHDSARCVNMPGSFNCLCNPGYTGSGSDCDDINECDSENECDQFAKCTNTQSSYKCYCPTGYFGNGYNCTVAQVIESKEEDASTYAYFDNVELNTTEFTMCMWLNIPDYIDFITIISYEFPSESELSFSASLSSGQWNVTTSQGSNIVYITRLEFKLLIGWHKHCWLLSKEDDKEYKLQWLTQTEQSGKFEMFKNLNLPAAEPLQAGGKLALFKQPDSMSQASSRSHIAWFNMWNRVLLLDELNSLSCESAGNMVNIDDRKFKGNPFINMKSPCEESHVFDRVLTFTAEYKVACLTSAVSRELISSVAKHLYKDIEAVCDCRTAQAAPEITCKANTMRIVWPTDLTFDPSVKLRDVAMYSQMIERIKSAAKTRRRFMEITVLSKIPPVANPVNNDEGLVLLPGLSKSCWYGQTYNKQTKRCIV